MLIVFFDTSASYTSANIARVLVLAVTIHSIGPLPVTAKADSRAAFVIANAALTIPHALRKLDVPSEAQVDLSMLLDFDVDLAAQVRSATSRLRGLLFQIHPSLEKSL